MLLIHDDEQAFEKLSEAERRAIYDEYATFTQEITASGHFIGGFELQPSATATIVRVRGGKRMVTDGPFAETREQLGGYYLVEAASLDEALDLAARIPSARTGSIEVRPVVPEPMPA
jgi:hypothetical protein